MKPSNSQEQGAIVEAIRAVFSEVKKHGTEGIINEGFETRPTPCAIAAHAEVGDATIWRCHHYPTLDLGKSTETYHRDTILMMETVQ